MRQNDDEFREQSCEAVRFRGISSKQIWFLNLIALHVLNLETSATWLARDRLANQALELYGDCVELRWLIAANTTRCPARAKKQALSTLPTFLSGTHMGSSFEGCAGV